MASKISPYISCFAGAAALAVAMGIGRFAFTPMLPLMIREGGLTLQASVWLAAANYFGYCIGAAMVGRLKTAPQNIAAAGLIGVALSTLAMGLTASVWLWAASRGAAGLFSAWVLVGASAWALQGLAQAGRPNLGVGVYAGVGFGVALTGVYCLFAAGAGMSAARLWLALGGLAVAMSLAPLYFFGPWFWQVAPEPPLEPRLGPTEEPVKLGALAWCYGAMGFGYILPATYLPTLGRELIDDPRIFGLAWPLFGSAALVSTLCAGAACIQNNRLRAWALSQFIMAVGAFLPSVWLSPASLALSTLCIGGNYMVVTALGLQEARLRAPKNSARALGRMTTAFAIGQLAGPLALLAAPANALNFGLQCAAVALLVSAATLWRSSQTRILS